MLELSRFVKNPIPRVVAWLSRPADRPLLARALCAAACAPLALDLVAAWGPRGWFDVPRGDEAVLTLVALDALDGAPALGAYSRFGWHHPGPALIHQLELGLSLFGRDPAALPWFVAGVSLACVVLGLLVVARDKSAWVRYAMPLAALLSFVSLDRASEPDFVLAVWNPAVAIAPCFLLLALAVTRPRGGWRLPVAVLVHAYLTQAHVGYLAIASLLLVVVVGRALRPLPPRGRAGWLAAAVVAAVIAWWSLWETWPNLIEIARFFAGASRGPSFGAALALAAERTQGGWLVLAPDGASPVLPLALLAAQVVLLVDQLGRRVRGSAGAPWPLVALSLGALAVAVASAAAVDDVAHVHQTHWLVLVGSVAWVIALWPRREGLTRGAWLLAGAIVVLAVVGHADRAFEEREAWAGAASEHVRTVRALADALEPLAEREPIQLRFSPREHELWGFAAGTAVELQGRGTSIFLDRRYRFMFGPRRTRCPGACRTLWIAHDPPEGARTIATARGLTLLER